MTTWTAAAAAALATLGCGPEAVDERELDQTVPGCAAAGTAYTIWVPNQGREEDAVYVLEPRGGGDDDAQVLARIHAGRSPHNVGFSPDGRFAWVANLTDPQRVGTVTVIDTASFEVVATVEAGVMPHWVALSPDGHGRWAWVANVGGREVTVIDTASYAVDGTIETGEAPAQIQFSVDGAKAWVSNGEDGTVAVVEVETRRVVKTIPTGEGSMGLVLTNDGRFVFETEPHDDRVSVIDASLDLVIAVLTFGDTLLEPHGIAVAGAELLVTNATEGSIAFVDAGSFERVASIAMPGRPQAVAVSPDCRTAYLPMQDAVAIGVVDVREREIAGVIDMGIGNVHGIALLPARREP